MFKQKIRFNERLKLLRKFALLIILGALIWSTATQVVLPGWIIDKCRFRHLQKLSTAVHRFKDKYERLPSSFSEIAEAGFLDGEEHVFTCPIKRKTLWPEIRSVEECDYELIVDPNGAWVVIKVPVDNYAGWSYYFYQKIIGGPELETRISK